MVYDSDPRDGRTDRSSSIVCFCVIGCSGDTYVYTSGDAFKKGGVALWVSIHAFPGSIMYAGTGVFFCEGFL